MPMFFAQVRLMVRALAHRNFRLFFVGQGLSLIGTWMQQIATPWLVYRLSGSPFLLGLSGCAMQIPTIFLSPLAGVVADRCDRRMLVLLNQIVSMVQAFLLAGLAFTKVITVGEIIALNLLVGVANTFDMAARQVLMREMVEGTDDVANAIALNSMLVNSARLIGPTIAGLMIASMGEASCFLLNGISYVPVIAALLAMDLPRVTVRTATPLTKGLTEGITYTFDFQPVREVLVLLALVTLAGAPYAVLLPLFATDVFGGGPDTLGYLAGAGGLGALLAACRLAGRKSLRGIGIELAATGALFGVGLIAFPYAGTFPIAMVVLFVLGFTQMELTTGINAVLHEIVEEDKRGRVMGFFMLAATGIAPLGSLVAGALAHHIGASVTVMAGGPFCIVASFLFARKIPRLREQAIRVIRERERARKHFDSPPSLYPDSVSAPAA